MTDPVADMITRIKNAYLARKKSLEVPYSGFKEKIAKILVKEGYLEKVTIESPKSKTKKTLKLDLKYKGKKGAITQIKRLSKPGLRVYAKVKKIPKVLGGQGISIISTPKGLMTDKEAREKKLGGEVLLKVY